MSRSSSPTRRTAQAVTALAVAGALLLSACGGDGGAGPAAKGEDKPTDSLKFYNDKGGWKEAFVQVGAAAKKDAGVGMEPVGYSDSNAYTAFIRSSFRTKEKPDLFTWHTGKELEDLVDQGLVADTTEQWTKAIADGNIPEALKQYFTFGDKQYCVPLLAGYWVMYYNKSVFAKAGVTPPKTWPELIAVADKLKAAGVKPFYQTNILFSFVWFETLLAGKYPDLYDALAQGKAKYTDPGVVEVMNDWKKMIEAGYFSDPGAKTEPQAQLKNGDVAMVNFGTWFSGSLNTLKMKPGTDYDFFVIPNVDPSLPKTSMVFETGPVCSAAAGSHSSTVDKWTSWWVSPQAQTAWANARGDLSFNPKAEVKDPGLAALNKDVGGDGYRLINRWFEATPVPVANKALEVFGAFVTKPGDPMPGLQKIQAEADAYWAKQK
jgi:multiple sugar transport system substrate-binding protein